METIKYEDFAKVDLRVGKVISATQIEESEKLIKLSVDLGEENPRQILAGIKKFYEAEDLIGKNIIVVANLEPRSLMGYESHGMLLAASDENETPVVLTTEKDTPSGSKIR